MRKQSATQRLSLTALILACSIATATQAKADSNAGTQVDMLDCAGLPCITVQLAAGKPVKLLLDSGDATSLLDLGEAKAFGLPLEPYKGHDGKVVPGYFTTTVAEAKLGSLSLPPVKFLVIDLQKSIADGTTPPSNGFLSYLALNDRVVTLDYRRHRVTISATSAEVAAPNDAGTLTYPTFGQKGPPIVATTGFAVNGKPITVQVDTLYAGTLLIYPTSVGKLGLDAEAAVVKLRKFPFTDDGVDMIEGKASEESFDNKTLKRNAALYFATPKVHLPDGMFDGTVGGELFQGRSITFDFHANRFWIG
jgi:hypothetical protein